MPYDIFFHWQTSKIKGILEKVDYSSSDDDTFVGVKYKSTKSGVCLYNI